MQAKSAVVEAAVAYVEAFDKHLQWVLGAEIESDVAFQSSLKQQQEAIIAKRKALAEAVYRFKAHAGQ